MAKKKRATRSPKKRAKKPTAKPTTAVAKVAKRRGPKRKPIDEKKVENAIAAGKTVENAAALVGVSHDTLETNCPLSIKRGRTRRNSRLQEAMFKAALEGNVTSQIWLSKQWLGMTEPAKVQMFGEEVARIGGFTPAEFERETISLILEKVQRRITRGDSEKKP